MANVITDHETHYQAIRKFVAVKFPVTGCSEEAVFIGKLPGLKGEQK